MAAAEEEEQLYDEGGYEEEIPVGGSDGSAMVDMQVRLSHMFTETGCSSPSGS